MSLDRPRNLGGGGQELHLPASVGPELRSLLEPGEILSTLREIGEGRVEVTGARVRHIRIHPDKDTLVFVIATHRCPHTGVSGESAVTIRCESAETYERERRRARIASAEPGHILQTPHFDDALRAIWVEFPNDSRLPHLALSSEPLQLARILEPSLRSAVPEGLRVDEESFQVTRLRYKPERRLVCGCKTSWRDEEGRVAHELSVVLRFERTGLAETVTEVTRRLHEALSPLPGVSTPRVLCSVPSCEVVGVEKVEGRTLSEWLESERGPVAARRAGRLLAQLHGCGAFPEGPEGRPARRRDLAVVRQNLLEAGQELERDATSIIDRLCAMEARTAPGPAGTIHGDFHPEQVLLAHGADPKDADAWFLDLEWSGSGETTFDVGHFCGQLWYAAHRRRIPDFEGFRSAFLEGYEGECGHRVERRRLRLHTAFSILELCSKHFRRMKAGWPKRVRHGLREVSRILTELEQEEPV